MVTSGTPMVRADTLTSGPLPASLTAWMVTSTAVSSANPSSVTAVPVTSTGPLPASTTYLSILRPLSWAGRQATWTAPRRSATVAAPTFCGGPGVVKGTTVLLAGEDGLPALRSLIATTRNAYCVPYVSEPFAIVMLVPVTEPTGAWIPPVTEVTVYERILRPCPLASPQL